MRYLFLFITLSVLQLSCSSSKNVQYNADPSIQLQQILEDGTTDENGISGISLTVISPELDINFSNATGYDSTEKKQALHVEQPFRIASLTKVFVATGILRLHEKGLLSIEDVIGKHISQEHIDILRKGGYNPDNITIRHCLMHMSGLYDYAEGGPDYIEEASKDPAKRWTRTEQIQFAMDHGKPQGAPGEIFHYSDTGYVLLGEIIERLDTGLAEGLRSLLKFNELGMSSTYLESLEERPVGLLSNVKRYMETTDASDWDNSIDLYGGGGLVSNTKDLTVFLQALFNGGIYEQEDTLPIMLLKKEYNEKPLPSQRLGFGSVSGKKSGLEVYLHSGFWGTFFMHIPKYNCSIAMNNTNDGDNNVLQQVIDYVIWLGEQQSKS